MFVLDLRAWMASRTEFAFAVRVFWGISYSAFSKSWVIFSNSGMITSAWLPWVVSVSMSSGVRSWLFQGC